MDYLAFDPATKSLWVPAGNTGSVDVIDTTNDSIRRIADLPVAEIQNGERKRTVGPSSASVGASAVYVGNRADSSVCSFDAKTLAPGKCGHVTGMPDAVTYVSTTREVWITTPRDNTIHVLDAATLDQKASFVLEGAPEGYAVDAKRGIYFTNLEDRDQTLAIDVRTKKRVGTWKSGCGEDGPRGLVLGERGDLLFVACTDRVEAMDVRHKGRIVASVQTGTGVDSIDYSAATGRIFAGAAKSGDLTIIDVDRAGHLQVSAHVMTGPGARNGVLSGDGALYLAHSPKSELLVVTPAR